jgi:thiamine-monophosphate kinase
MALRELLFVEWLRQQTGQASDAVAVGIGDDAAVLRVGPELCLVTTDMIVEGTHFVWGQADPERVGHKAMNVNLSDIAAMGGWPLVAFAAVAVPRQLSDQDLQRLFEGLIQAGLAFGCVLAGGDTNGTTGPLALAVTVVGRPGPKGPVLRSGARPGDALIVTGTLGGSILGKHLDFTPRLPEAIYLASELELHALMDLSDGLALDGHRMASSSHCRLILEEEALPISAEAHALPGPLSPLEHALYDGEDFELLVALPPSELIKLERQWPFPTPWRRIGWVETGEGLYLKRTDGTLQPLEARGYDHLGQPGSQPTPRGDFSLLRNQQPEPASGSQGRPEESAYDS